MEMETIELEVDPETARRYREAGPAERARVAQVAARELDGAGASRGELAEAIRSAAERARQANTKAGVLDEALGAQPTSIEVARLAGDLARANGLTDETLASLLNE